MSAVVRRTRAECPIKAVTLFKNAVEIRRRLAIPAEYSKEEIEVELELDLSQSLEDDTLRVHCVDGDDVILNHLEVRSRKIAYKELAKKVSGGASLIDDIENELNRMTELMQERERLTFSTEMWQQSVRSSVSDAVFKRGDLSVSTIQKNLTDSLQSSQEEIKALQKSMIETAKSLEQHRHELIRLDAELERLMGEVFWPLREVTSSNAPVNAADSLKAWRALCFDRREVKSISLSLSLPTAEAGAEAEAVPASEASSHISREKSGIQVEVTYSIPHSAAWRPTYELRLKESGSTSVGKESSLVVAYKGSAWQRSGEEWREVDAFLSTGDAVLSSEPQTLPALKAEYPPEPKPVVPVAPSAPMGLMQARSGPMHMKRMMMAPSVMAESADAVSYCAVNGNLTSARTRQVDLGSGAGSQNAVFKLPSKMVLRCDGVEQKFTLLQKEMACRVVSFCRLEASPRDAVFRLIFWKNESDLLFLPSEGASVFEGATLVGKCNVQLTRSGQSSYNFIGEDKKMRVSSSKPKEFRHKPASASSSTVGFLSSLNALKENKQVYEQHFKVQVEKPQHRESDSEAYTFVGSVRLPTSTDETIKVNLLQPSVYETAEHTDDMELLREKLSPSSPITSAAASSESNPESAATSRAILNTITGTLFFIITDVSYEKPRELSFVYSLESPASSKTKPHVIDA